MDVGIWDLEITDRCEAKASHRIKINIIKAINESSEPIEDTTFHLVNASG
jgi:hypothetical protein